MKKFAEPALLALRQLAGNEGVEVPRLDLTVKKAAVAWYFSASG